MVNWVSLRTSDVTIELIDAATFWDTERLSAPNPDAVSRAHDLVVCRCPKDVTGL
jgi:hypothetical protein